MLDLHIRRILLVIFWYHLNVLIRLLAKPHKHVTIPTLLRVSEEYEQNTIICGYL